jgi:hypothetical protein
VNKIKGLLWEPRPMPEVERVALTLLAACLWAVALVMNVTHVKEHLGQGGIHDWRADVLCWGPDVLLLIAVWKLRYSPTHLVSWISVTLGVTWLTWAGLSTADPTGTARMFAVLPIVMAVLVTLKLEFRGAPSVAPAATVVKPVRQPRKLATAVPSVRPEVVVEQSAPAEAPVQEPVEPAARRSATDEDLERVVRPLVLGDSGRPSIKKALEAEGLSCGNERLGRFIAGVRSEADVIPLRAARS